MIIYPAIDIINSCCVRLRQGDYDKKTVFDKEPSAVARRWEGQGAKWLHVVDLDGAKSGEPQNLDCIAKICADIDIPVQLGGGIRCLETLKKVFNSGVARAIIGTAAAKAEDFVQKAVQMYPGRIAIGIDAKNGVAAVEGWSQSAGISALELAAKAQSWGAAAIIYTDIATDGMMAGPNLEAMREMAQAVSTPVIASGGVSCRDDVFNLNSTGVEGVIIGRALYDKAIDLGRLIGEIE